MGELPVLTFGEELRRERLIREVSLEEISSSTKISIRLLTALENSDVAKLPAPVFTRGFIRSYSRHLGLDQDEMVNAYLADLAPEKSRDATAKKGGFRSRFLRGRRAAASTIVVSVTAILLVLGLIARPERRSASATPIAQRRVAPVTFKNVAVSPGPAPAMQAAAPAQPPKTAGVSMVLEFEQDSWTEVTTSEGQPIFSGMSRRGTSQRFEAQEGFRLTLGNAGGVRVTVDGHPLEPLGGAGQVVRNLSLPARLTQS
ncbi:MAG TPA: RodZ domain-containing protein [Thermoanaerobaculia bacterium]|jgi:cytoskeleton protein RodZ|nr:RodZ domain-containing protein [Thermoanaerobaculia bacterium]